ncbi:hypothetical protein ACHQM5_018347 [Ranunculus cassubicifolius]
MAVSLSSRSFALLFLIFVCTSMIISPIFAKRIEVNRKSLARELAGSSPPTCNKKCGTCTPCERVLVTPPGGTGDAQVWRCKCDGQLYNP